MTNSSNQNQFISKWFSYTDNQYFQQRIYLNQDIINIFYDDINSFENMPDSPEIGRYISRVLMNYCDIFKPEKRKIPKRGGESFQLLINGKVQDKLKSIEQDVNKNDFEYLKDFIESALYRYAELTYCEREAIYFGETVKKINNCLISSKPYTLKFNFPKDTIVEMKPFKLMTDHSNTFNYLIGMVSQNDGSEKSWAIASFRLQRIKNLDDTLNFFKWEKSELKAIQNAIKAPDSIPYLSFKPVRAKVRLTEKGIYLYKSVIMFQRPHYTRISPDDKHIFEFECSEYQLHNYFIKFGEDAEIIEPVNLRKTFMEMHKKALKMYED